MAHNVELLTSDQAVTAFSPSRRDW